jgi:hypothetical protein
MQQAKSLLTLHAATAGGRTVHSFLQFSFRRCAGVRRAKLGSDEQHAGAKVLALLHGHHVRQELQVMRWPKPT